MFKKITNIFVIVVFISLVLTVGAFAYNTSIDNEIITSQSNLIEYQNKVIVKQKLLIGEQ